MERLTSSNKEIPTLTADNETYWLKVYFKLKEYEDLEEQGLLLKLPCKINDAIYTIILGKIEEYIVSGFSVLESNMLIQLEYECEMHTYHRTIGSSKLGKTWFLTKAEAEKALAEMEK
jgi:hypothetical protein